MRYRLRHVTRYGYDDVVTDSLGVAYLVPRDLPAQQVLDYDVRLDPPASDLSVDLDCYGNHVTFFQVTTPHRELVVEGVGLVETADAYVPPEALARPWEQARPLVASEPAAGPDPVPSLTGASRWPVADFALVSPAVTHDAAARAYAASSLRPGRPIGEAASDLMHRVHAEFDYDPTATTVTSTVPEILERRAGVCQDFAHLMLACLRGHGLAARYVSGYLATDPPPGKERVVGADASHAWVEVLLGDLDGVPVWLGLDPTNDQVPGERYVTVARGRDYGDVTPLKGVIFTEATTSTMDVSVDVAPVTPQA